jgi:hypothetical protein
VFSDCQIVTQSERTRVLQDRKGRSDSLQCIASHELFRFRQRPRNVLEPVRQVQHHDLIGRLVLTMSNVIEARAWIAAACPLQLRRYDHADVQFPSDGFQRI